MRRKILGNWMWIGMWAAYLGLAVIGFSAGCSAAMQRSTHVQAAGPRHPGGSTAGAHAGHAAPRERHLTARQAWRQLAEGNARYVGNRAEHPNQSAARRLQVATGQQPFAVVLTCSDSRVPPEILFDTGIGDIFVVRVAGNTANDAALGSIEYAVEHLGVPLIVVLGHERCGAVEAAAKMVETRERPAGHLGAILNPIVPAVTAVQGLGGDEVDKAVRENVVRVAKQLKASKPVLAEAVRKGHLAVVGAMYDLDSGQISVVEQRAAMEAAH